MTTLAEMYDVWWPPGRCSDSTVLTNSKTATEMYNGTTRPDFWLASLAFVNLEESKRVMVVLLKDAAALLSAGDLKTKLLALTHTDDAAAVEANRLWAKNRKKARTTENDLERALYEMARFLQTEAPKCIMVPSEFVISYRVAQGAAVDVAAARADMYTILRAEVPEATWKGPYT